LLVIAIAANKADMYDLEEIEESVGRNFAKEINAVFKYTSAKNASGIEELFRIIGSKFLDPNYEDENSVPGIIDNGDTSDVKKQTLKLTKNVAKSADKKKVCC